MKALLVICLVSLLATAGCAKGPKSTRTFRLPEGSGERGRTAFVALKCHECHTVAGIELPAPARVQRPALALGGEVVRLRTYGDLLTAIVHPNHELSDQLPIRERKEMGRSPMPSVNEVMTVSQMIDLVTFLQPRYRQLEPMYEFDYRITP